MARALIVVGAALLAAALIWTGLILVNGSAHVGSLAGSGDWIWVILEATLKTGLLWALGLFLLISGGIGRAGGSNGRRSPEPATDAAPLDDTKPSRTLDYVGLGLLALALVLTLRTISNPEFLDLVKDGGAIYWLGLGGAVATKTGLIWAAGIGLIIAGRARRR